MPLIPMKPVTNVNRLVQSKIDQTERALLEIFKQAGLATVDYMRSLTTFQNRTANLRNSEGFILFKDGDKVFEYYPNDAKPNEFSLYDGAAIGKNLANEVAASSPRDGFFFIVTAGMGYAAYVEAKGRDVITGGSKMGSKFLKAKVNQLIKKSNKRKW